MTFLKNNLLVFLVIFFASLIVHTRHLDVTGFEHRSNDEFLYYKASTEMVKAGNYFSPTFFGENRFEKPILYYWLIIAGFKFFGISWVSARAVSALLASFVICLSWLISRRFFDVKVSLLSCLILMSTPLFFAHTRTAVPDMSLNFFIVLGFYALMRFIDAPQKRTHALLLFGSCGLGFMVKGFPALVPILGLVLFSFINRKASLLKQASLLWGIILLILIVAPWFLYMIDLHGQSFYQHVLVQEVEKRIVSSEQSNMILAVPTFIVRNFFYYLGIIWNNLAPWSLFLFAGFPYFILKSREDTEEKEGLDFSLNWIYSVFFLFVLIAMEQYNIQYMLILTTPAAILASYILLRPFESKNRLARMARFLRKFVCMFIFSVGYLLFGYFNIFFAQKYQLLTAAFVIVLYGFVIVSVKKSKSNLFAPAALALIIICVTANMSFFKENRLSRFSSLEKVADVIVKEEGKRVSVGIGRSIDRKKFWIFFDEKLRQGSLRDLMQIEEVDYIVVTDNQLKRDHQDLLMFGKIAMGQGGYSLFKEDFIIAKKMELDAKFFKGLATLDRKLVESYILEKIYLVRKSNK